MVIGHNMKVITRGISEWTQEVECNRCRSTLEIGETDVKSRRDEDDCVAGVIPKVYEYYCRCKVCGYDIILGYQNPVRLNLPQR